MKSDVIKKLLLVPILLLVACLMAGTYGAIHNQISYSVSPEYFTQFKFFQFSITDSIPDRLGAAVVGWFGSWWMGLAIGIFLIPAGLVLSDALSFWKGVLKAFAAVTLTAMVVGLAALAVAFGTVSVDTVGEFTRYGNEIVDDVAFARAGAMHNFSYLGGGLGIISGWLPSITLRIPRGKKHRNSKPK